MMMRLFTTTPVELLVLAEAQSTVGQNPAQKDRV